MYRKKPILSVVLVVALAFFTFGCEGKPTGTKATGGGWIASACGGPSKATFGFNAHLLEQVIDDALVNQSGVFSLTKGQLQYVDHDCTLAPLGVPLIFQNREFNIHGEAILGHAGPLMGPGVLTADVTNDTGAIFWVIGIYWPKVKIGEIELPLMGAAGIFVLRVEDRGEPGVTEGDRFCLFLFPFVDDSALESAATVVNAVQSLQDADLAYFNCGELQGGNIQVNIELPTDGASGGKGRRK